MHALGRRARLRGGHVTHQRPDPHELNPGNYLVTIHEDGTFDAWPVDEGGWTARGLGLPGLGYLFTLLRQHRARRPRLGRPLPARWQGTRSSGL